MTPLKRSQLVNAAKELNDKVIDPKSAIDTTSGKSNNFLEEKLAEAGQIVEPTDDLSKETWEVLEALRGGFSVY